MVTVKTLAPAGLARVIRRAYLWILDHSPGTPTQGTSPA